MESKTGSSWFVNQAVHTLSLLIVEESMKLAKQENTISLLIVEESMK